MRRRWFHFISPGLLAAGVLGFRGLSLASDSGAPSWINHPKSDDSVFLYRVGHAEGLKDRVAAQQAAYRNALTVIAGEMLVRAGVDESLRPELVTSLPVQNAEIVPGAVHLETNETGYACWVQVSYPLAEKTKLLEQIEPEKKRVLAQIEFDKRITGLLAEARADFGGGKYDVARTKLHEVIANYPKLRTPSFDVQEARILLGDTHGAQKDFLAARQCYAGVTQGASATQWTTTAAARLKALPKAPRAWPLHDRWGGKKVALVCAIRNVGQEPRPFTALGGVLGRDLSESGMESIDMTGDIAAGGVENVFNQQAFAVVCEAARRNGAGVVLAVLLTLDPSKRGQTKETMGISMPVADSDAAFWVVNVESGRTLYGDRFSDFSGTRSESQFAQRLASILVEKYLVPKCPALGGE